MGQLLPTKTKGSGRIYFVLTGVLLFCGWLLTPSYFTISVMLPESNTRLKSLSTNYHTRVENVMHKYSSRITRDAWSRQGPNNSPPIFFLTAARSWGVSTAEVEAVREEQYASNLGNILTLGYQVYLAVSPTGGRKWDLVEALQESAAPGQLRVHYCSNLTSVARRSGGPDEILCIQEAIESLFAGCILPYEPYTPLQPYSPCCPAPDTHVVRMSGRYLMAKYHLLHAIFERGLTTDAFVKWGTRWTESKDIDFPQVYTFFLSMRVSK